MKMEKTEFRVLLSSIFYVVNKTINETEDKLKIYYGESAASLEMVHEWFSESRCGRPTTNGT